MGGRHLSCKSIAFGHKATSSLLVKKALRTCSHLIKKLLMRGGLLAVVGGMLVKELLATIGLLSLTSSFLVKMALAGCCLLAMALVFPQFVHNSLPVLVGGLLASKTSGKNWTPQWQWWDQPCGLFVFKNGPFEGPIFV